ncbi:MAG: hypothetical protein K2Y37_26480 [Pirellulales bacterium]|nr:hypothetical protein [Pirellulales bacterium]
MTRRHLISEDELRAAGALDVPPEWRKSLSAGCKLPREQMLFGDDDLYPEAQPPTSAAPSADAADSDDESDRGDEDSDESNSTDDSHSMDDAD